MAAFDDSNDIKINVTVDTESAIDAAKGLGNAFKEVSKIIGVDFKELSQAAKAFSQAQVAQIKANSAEEIATLRAKNAERLAEIKSELNAVKEAEATKRTQIEGTAEKTIASIRLVQNAYKQGQITRRAEIETEYKQEIQKLQNTLTTVKETEGTKRAELKSTYNLAIQNLKNESKEARSTSSEKIATIKAESANYKAELQKDVKVFQQVEATKRAELKKTTEEIRLEATKVRKATAEAQIAGAGKAAAGITGSGGLPAIAAGVFLVEKAAEAAAKAVGFVAQSIATLAKEGERVQALTSAFNTLQQSVGRDPAASIDRLRQATQGLIADTELYQKANQAVLLGVPTQLFEESAEAAVKLGRAMGVDAAFALESLSIGLGRQSRLYLDNLGIVVSASEAYRNFARENNIVGRELTETEKRLAFFNEASKKLKEGLASLPPIADDVGTAFRRISSTSQNLFDQFALGFNQNRSLAESLNTLNAKASPLSDTFKQLGSAVSKFFSILIDIPIVQKLADGLIGLGKAAVQTVDDLVDGSRGAIEDRIQELPSKIKKAVDDISYYQNKAVKQPDMLKDAIDTFNSLTNEYGKLTTQIRDLDTEASREIKLKVNTEEISQASSETETFFASLEKATQESLGLVQIPGLNPEQLKEATTKADELFLAIANGGVKAAEAGVRVKILAESIGDIVNKTNLQAFEKDLANVNARLSENPGSEQLKVDKETLEQKIDLLKKAQGLNASEREQIKKLLDERQRLAKQSYDKSIKDTNKFGKASKNAIEDLRKEYEKFGRQARQSLDEAIPKNIQREILDLFRSTSITTAQFAQALGAIAVKAQQSGADIEVLREIVEDLQNQIAKGVKPIELKINGPKGGSQDPVESVKQTVVDIRAALSGIGIEIGKEGGFFGFDASGIFGDADQKALADSIQSSIASGLNSVTGSLLSEDYEQAAEDIGATIGAVVGASIEAAFFGSVTGIGAALGATIGSAIGKAVFAATSDGPGTKQRKDIDGYFAELFEGGRLAVVMQGQITGAIDEATGQAIRETQPQLSRISDLVFEGMTPFAGQVDFGGEGFSSYFETLSTDVQAAFNGIGIAFGKLNGIASEEARLIGIALANNIGGSLQNLQVLIQATGESFDDLAKAVLDSFLDAQLTIEEAYNSLVQLQNLYGVGIPNAVGAYKEAIDNLNTSLESDAPGRYAIDSLRDIGAEGIEAGKAFDSVISSLAQTFNFTADQQARLFEALRINGIASLEQLQNASNEQLLAILRNVQLIRDNAQAPLVTTPTTTFEKPSGGGRPSGPRKKSPEEERQEKLKKLREETQKLLRESTKYAEILQKITDGELTSAAAGEAIVAAQREIRLLLQTRNNLEEEYANLLAKGRRADKQRLAEIAAALDANRKAIEEFANGAKKGESAFKKLDISAIIPLIKSANSLGVVSRAVGVDLEKVQDILLLAFRQGKITLEEYNKQLKETEDNLGAGIPNAVGAVSTAFQNLIDAGTKGGEFSIDAFSDIFAEFREKFENEGSAFRQQQRASLLQALEDAKKAAETAVGPDAAKQAQEALKAAQKALDDFYATIPAPSLADLRSELEKSFSGDQVNAFFQALDESGLNSFDQLAGAGPEAITKILARMQELGFSFGETSEEIAGIIGGLNDASNAANGNKDPIQEALDLIKQFNEGANALPPAFDKTNEAVSGLSGTLETLNAGFDDIIKKLSELSGLEFRNTIIFDVKTEGSPGAAKLVEILFGDGSTTTTGTGNGDTGTGGGGGATTNTPGPSLSRLKRRLRRLVAAGKGNTQEAKDLRRKIREMEGN